MNGDSRSPYGKWDLIIRKDLMKYVSGIEDPD